MISQLDMEKRQDQAYSRLFKGENLLRVGMHSLIVNKEGLAYDIASLFPPFNYVIGTSNVRIDVAKEVTKRKSKERQYNILMGFEYPGPWFLDFSYLMALLDQFWVNYFKDLFITDSDSQSAVVSRMRAAHPVRNAIAHNRFVSEIDFGDITAFCTTVEHYIKPDFTADYNQLVFTKLALLREEICSTIGRLRIEIESRRIITPKRTNELGVLLSAFYQARPIIPKAISAFEQFRKATDSYNNLSRKPKESPRIAKFVHESGILSKLDELASIVRNS